MLSAQGLIMVIRTFFRRTLLKVVPHAHADFTGYFCGGSVVIAPTTLFS